MVFRPAASASPGDLFKMQICRIHRRLTKSGTLGEEPSNLCFHKPLDDSGACLILKITELGYP